MNKSELCAAIAEDTGWPTSEALAAVNAVTNAVTDALVAGDKVTLPGFATFAVADRPARTGRNPATGETLKLPATRVVKISAGATLKEAVKPKSKVGKKKK